MKKLVITCALITSASMVSFAQNQAPQPTPVASNAAAMAPQANSNMPTAEDMAARRSKMVQQQYGLNDEQYKGIYAVELDFSKQMLAERASGKQPDPSQHMQMMQAKDAKYKQVMTADQYAKYEASHPKMPPEPATAPQTK